MLYDAKMKAIELSKNFSPPKKSTYNLPGKPTLALTLAMLQEAKLKYQYDKYIEKIALVLSGGDTDINKELSEEIF